MQVCPLGFIGDTVLVQIGSCSWGQLAQTNMKMTHLAAEAVEHAHMIVLGNEWSLADMIYPSLPLIYFQIYWTNGMDPFISISPKSPCIKDPLN